MEENQNKIKRCAAIVAAALVVVFQSVMSRMSGGGLLAEKLPKFLPELLFSLSFGVVASRHFSEPLHAVLIGLACVAWSYLWMQTGHGTAYHMAANPAAAQGDRKQFLSIVIDPICKLFSQPLGEAFYCWTFMGLKGALIHLPLGFYAAPAAILWPLAYYIGHRLVPRFYPKIEGTAVAETIAGATSGVLIICAF